MRFPWATCHIRPGPESPEKHAHALVRCRPRPNSCEQSAAPIYTKLWALHVRTHYERALTVGYGNVEGCCELVPQSGFDFDTGSHKKCATSGRRRSHQIKHPHVLDEDSDPPRGQSAAPIQDSGQGTCALLTCGHCGVGYGNVESASPAHQEHHKSHVSMSTCLNILAHSETRTD